MPRAHVPAAIQAGSKWTRDELDAVVTATAASVTPQEIFLLEYLPDNGECGQPRYVHSLRSCGFSRLHARTWVPCTIAMLCFTSTLTALSVPLPLAAGLVAFRHRRNLSHDPKTGNVHANRGSKIPHQMWKVQRINDDFVALVTNTGKVRQRAYCATPRHISRQSTR